VTFFATFPNPSSVILKPTSRLQDRLPDAQRTRRTPQREARHCHSEASRCDRDDRRIGLHAGYALHHSEKHQPRNQILRPSAEGLRMTKGCPSSYPCPHIRGKDRLLNALKSRHTPQREARHCHSEASRCDRDDRRIGLHAGYALHHSEKPQPRNQILRPSAEGLRMTKGCPSSYPCPHFRRDHPFEAKPFGDHQ
jgi:hypothetical protein